jgi:ParB/RepB/Spo0J family partition protein
VTTAPAEPPAAGDFAGINGIPAVLPLADLAPHPRNPRSGLGDLTEITASISAHGVFEPLVVLTRAAYEAAADADADTMRPVAGGWTHVIVMGHRRAAASRAAGLAEVPAVVRDDLAGADAIAAMIGENMHRAGLEPLAESEAFGELARRGWSQRKIAGEIGCSQAHVSKRLTLLKLPAPARDAVVSGQLPVAQAVELHQALADVDDDVADEVMAKAIGSIASGWQAGQAVAAAGRDAKRFQLAKKTRADLGTRSIPVVDSGKRHSMGWAMVSGRDTRIHEKAGCLVAGIDYDGRPDYACTSPASHPGASRHDIARARQQEDEKEARKASRLRDSACTAIAAGPLPGAGELARTLAGALLEGSGHGESLRTACKWLRDAGTAPAGTDHYAWHRQLTAAGDQPGLARYAYAYALAADELHARSRWHSWGPRHTAHLDRLTAGAGYEPTGWELARLDEARQVQAARGVLTCACGCSTTEPGSCSIEFNRDAGQPAYKCAWNCEQHKQHEARQEAGTRALGDEDLGALDDDGLGDLVTGLITAVDVSTAAGSRLPDDLGDAVDEARAALAAAWRERWRPRDGGESVTAALRDLAAAAAPYEASWTRELREALAALAEAGVISAGDTAGAVT